MVALNQLVQIREQMLEELKPLPEYRALARMNQLLDELSCIYAGIPESQKSEILDIREKRAAPSDRFGELYNAAENEKITEAYVPLELVA